MAGLSIAEMVGGIGQSTPATAGQSGIGGLLGQLSRSFSGASAGGLLSGGLGDWFLFEATRITNRPNE
jgi:hypothetical protein